MSIAEAAPRTTRPGPGTPTDVPLARLHHELQGAAREAVGDVISNSSSGAITAMLVALDELVRFESDLAATADDSLMAEIAARHEALRVACRAAVNTPVPTWDPSSWAQDLRHLLLAHFDATRALHGRSISL